MVRSLCEASLQNSKSKGLFNVLANEIVQINRYVYLREVYFG